MNASVAARRELERGIRRAVEQFQSEIQAHMDRLRETASQLRTGEVNAHHAANRIERIANEIAKAKEAK